MGVVRKVGSVLDQMCSSLFSFLVLLLAGRILPPSEFVAFALLVVFASLSQSISGALIGMPALALLNSSLKKVSRVYLLYVVVFVSIFGLMAIAILAVLKGFQLLLQVRYLELLLLGVSYSSYDVFRRVVYANKIGHLAFVGSVFSVIVFVGMSLLFSPSDWMQYTHIVVVSYLIGAIIFYIIVFLRWPEDTSYFSYKIIVGDHWRYSRWIVPGVLVYWAYSQGYLYFLSEHVDDKSLSSFRLVQNLASISTVFIVWFENHYTPILTSIFSTNKVEVTKLIVDCRLKMRKMAVAVGVVYVIIGPILASIFYNYFYASKFGETTLLFLAFFASQFILMIVRPDIVYLRSVSKNSIIFFAHVACAIATCGIGLFLVQRYGIGGAATAVVLGSISFFAVVFIGAMKNEVI